MKFLANCTPEEARKYNGKLVVPWQTYNPRTGKEGVKYHHVYLNIVVDSDIESVLKSGLGSATCITTTQKPEFCPTSMHGFVFYSVQLAQFNPQLQLPEGVTQLVNLPETFTDIRQLEDWHKESLSHVRFQGGHLLDTGGFKIGYFDDGEVVGLKWSKRPLVFRGEYNPFEILDLDEIAGIEERERKVRVARVPKSALEGSTASKVNRVRRVSKNEKKAAAFESLFGSAPVSF